MKMRPTAEYVRSVLDYDPETGLFRWRVSHPGIGIGEVAGRLSRTVGYWQIGVAGREYGAHRLAFLIMTGEWPLAQMDHIDLNRANNRWANLRPATQQQNEHNKALRKDSTSGIRGVSWNKLQRRWVAHIGHPVMKKTVHLGTFKDREEAMAAREAAETLMFGEFRYGAN